MKQKFAKLIDVKSIVTILLTAVFCVLAVRGTISTEQVKDFADRGKITPEEYTTITGQTYESEEQ